MIFCKHCSRENPRNYDVAVIGAGIVGLATARELILRYPHLSFVVLDKESKLGWSTLTCNKQASYTFLILWDVFVLIRLSLLFNVIYL